MSSIDNRIVQMQFENSQFESGVAQSLKSLANLKKGLDLKESGKSLEELQKAGNSFSLARMANGIEEVTQKFSAMGIIGRRILENVADSAYHAGTKLVKSLSIDQITSGWQKYADKTASVQTIIAATGKDINYVNEQLSKLAWFTDETSYNFVDMTSNIGKFTSMGIELDTSVTAMQGIATWAAVSGQNASAASRAMYNLSQAIGVGSVKLMDWKSIENANMATKEFKQTAIETAKALGVLNKQGKTKKGTLVGFENFSQTLSEGWFTKDVLLKTLEKYGEYADAIYKVSIEKGIPAAEAMELVSADTMQLGAKAFKAAQEAKTFAEAIDSVKDAVSTGWMNMFENVFGNYEEAKVLWTDLANYLWDIFASPLSDTNEILAQWKELGGREKMLKGIYNIFYALKGIILAVGDAIAQIFPPITVDNLMAASEVVENFGNNLRRILSWGEHTRKFLEEPDKLGKMFEEGNFQIGESTEAVKEFQKELISLGYLDSKYYGKYNSMTLKAFEAYRESINGTQKQLENTFKRGDKGEDVKKLQQELIKLGYDVGKSGADGIYGKNTAAAFEKYRADLGKTEKKRKQLKKGQRGEEVKELQQKLIDAKLLDEAQADGKFGPKTEAALKEWQKANKLEATGILDDATIAKMYATEEAAEKMKYGSEIVTHFGKNLGRLQNIVKGAAAGLDILWRVLSFLGKAGVKILGIFSPVVDMFLKIADAVSRFFVAFDERLKKSTKFQEWLDALDKFLSPIKEKISSLCQSFLDLIGLGGDLDDIDFNLVVDNLINAFKSLFGIGEGVDSALNNINSQDIVEKIKNKIVEIYTAIRDWISNLFKGNADLSKVGANNLNFDGYTLAIGALTILTTLLTKNILGIFKNVNGAVKYAKKSLKSISGFLSGIKNKTLFKNVNALATAILKFAGAVAIVAASVYALSTLSWENLAKGMLGFIAIAGVMVGAILLLDKFAKKIKNISKVAEIITSLGTSMASIAVVVLMLANLSWEGLAKGLIGMAALLLMCVGAIKVLQNSKISFKEVNGTIGLLGTLAGILGSFVTVIGRLGAIDNSILIKGFAGLIVLLFIVQKFVKSLKDIKIEWSAVAGILSIAIAVDAIIAGFVFMTLAMKIFSPADVIKGIIGISTIIIAMMAMMKVIGKIKPDVKAILALLPMAIALDLVIAGFIAMILIMKIAKPGDIAKAVAGVIALMLGMVGIMKLIEKVRPNIKAVLSLIPVAAALTIAIGGFVLLSLVMRKMSAAEIVKAIGGMVIVIFSIAGLMVVVENIKPNVRAILALIPVALALDLAIAGFILLALAMKRVDPDTIAKTIISFASIIVGMVAATNAMAKISGGIKGSISMLIGAVGMVIAIGAFALALTAVKDIDTGKIVSFALGFSAVMIAFGYFAKIASKVPITGFLKAAGGLLIMAGALAIIVAAVTAILNIPGVSDFLASGAAKLGEIIGSFTGAMKAADMKAFSKGMEGFKDVSKADEESVNNAIKCAELFSEFSSKLPSKGFIKKIGDVFIGSDMEHFAGDMKAFAKGFNTFAKQMETVVVDSQLRKKVNAALEIANLLKKFQDGLPQIDSGAKIEAYQKGLSPMAAFMQDAGGFAESYNSVASEMMKIEIPKGFATKVKNVTSALTPLKKFAEGLPEVNTWSGLVARILGLSPMSMFNSESLKFAEGFDAFAKAMDKVTAPTKELKSKTDSAVKIMDSIRDFATRLPEYSIWEKLGFLPTNTEVFMSRDISAFVHGINTFHDGIMGISFRETDGGETLKQKADSAVAVLKAIASFTSQDVPNYSAWEKLEIFSTNAEVFSYSDIPAFVHGINSFRDGIQGINFVETDGGENLEQKANSAVAVLKAISSFTSQDIPSYSNFEKLGFIWTSTQTFSYSDIPAFVEGINSFHDGINGISFIETDGGETLKQKADSAVAVLKAIASFERNDIPNYSGWEKLGFIRTNAEVFTYTDIAAFVKGINSFRDGIQGINFVESDGGESLEQKANSAVSVLKAVSAFAKNDLPKYSALNKSDFLELITGYSTDLQVFVDNDLTAFTKGVNAFATKMKDFNVVDDSGNDLSKQTEAAVGIMTQIANFISALTSMPIDKESGWLKSLFTDDTSQETVFDAAARMAQALSDSKSSYESLATAGINETIEKSIEAIRKVAEFLAYVGEEGMEEKITNAYGVMSLLDTYLSDSGSISVTLHKFAGAVADIENLDSTTSALSALSDFLNLLSGQGEVKISTKDFLGDLDASTVVETLSTFTSTLTDSLGSSTASITQQAQSFNDAGSALSSAVSAGLGSSVDTSALEKSVQAGATAISGHAKDFTTAGNFLATGLANGIRFNAYLAVKEAELMARKVIQRVNELFRINSPSKVFAEIGRYNDEGLAKGMTQYSGVVTKAAEGVGESTLDTARNSLSSLSSVLADDIDDTPVVRPIVDLTDARAAASSIGGMFHNQSFGVETTNLANRASAANAARVAANQNGSSSSGAAASAPSTNSAVNLTGNNFYVRSDQDISSLANEIATLNKQQQRSYGAAF